MPLIIDEIQKVPDLMETIKIRIDEAKRYKNPAGEAE